MSLRYPNEHEKTTLLFCVRILVQQLYNGCCRSRRHKEKIKVQKPLKIETILCISERKECQICSIVLEIRTTLTYLRSEDLASPLILSPARLRASWNLMSYMTCITTCKPVKAAQTERLGNGDAKSRSCVTSVSSSRPESSRAMTSCSITSGSWLSNFLPSAALYLSNHCL